MRHVRMWIVFILIVEMLFLGVLSFAKNQAPYSTAVKDIHIFYMVGSAESSYWVAVKAGAALAAKQLGVHIVFQEPQKDTEVSRQISILNTAIGLHPNAIIISPMLADSLVPGIKKAMSEGIKVIIINCLANTNDYSAYVSTNNFAAGEAIGKEFVNLIKAKTGQATPTGDIAYMTTFAGNIALEQRDNGFLAAIKKYGPGLKVVAHLYGNDSVQRSMTNFENFFTSHPNVLGVFADNEITGDGLIRAIPISGLTGKIVAVSFDSDVALIKALKNNIVQALVVQKPFNMGYESVFYAVDIIEGVYVPRFVDTGAAVVTRTNMNSPESQAVLNPLVFYKDLFKKFGVTFGR